MRICLLLALVLTGVHLNAAERPNVIIILVDDMGFSDIGAYGGEIKTPHIDSLAQGGVRFSQFYNASRCCPTRHPASDSAMATRRTRTCMSTSLGTRPSSTSPAINHLIDDACSSNRPVPGPRLSVPRRLVRRRSRYHRAFIRSLPRSLAQPAPAWRCAGSARTSTRRPRRG